MRVALGLSLLMLAGCASEKLAVVPSPKVDFSGRWKLNEADSDDPQRVALSQSTVAAGGAPGATGGQGGQGGQGGRGGRGGRGGGSAGGYGGGPAGPAMPGVNALLDGLRWPGKELEISQDAGTVTIASMGIQEVYRPSATAKSPPPAKPSDEAAGRGRDRGRDRGDGPPPLCGWDASTLVVQAENPDDDHPPFEERFSLSEDGARLIEVVAFEGGRSRGFTVSRVWDRVVPNAPSP